MSHRRIVAVCLIMLAGWGASPAWATNVGAGSNMSAIQGGVTGDGIINFDQSATLTMDATGTGVASITVPTGINAVIAFAANATQVQFKDAAAAITLTGTGTLAITGTNAGAGFDFDTVATGRTLTLTSGGDNALDAAVAANRFLLGSTNTLQIASTGQTINSLIITDTPTLDVNETATVTTMTVSGNVNLDVASNKTLTMTNQVVVGAGRIVTFTGTNDASAETLTLTGGLQLNGLNAELNVTGDNTTAMVVGGNVDGLASVTGGTGVTQIAGQGNLTLQVASGRTLTVTNGVDINDNTLTLAETGTTSLVEMDTAAGILLTSGSATVTTLTYTAEGTIQLGNATNLTITNAFNVGARKLTLTGSGGVAQDTLTATVTLDAAASELEVTGGADVDNIKGFTVAVAANGATLDVNNNCAPTAVNMTAAAGDLTL